MSNFYEIFQMSNFYEIFQMSNFYEIISFMILLIFLMRDFLFRFIQKHLHIY